MNRVLETFDKLSILSSKLLTVLINIYMILLIAVFPFYYEYGYHNMGTAKWNFFRIVTWSFPIRGKWYPGMMVWMLYILIIHIVCRILSKKWNFKVSLLDILAFIYLIVIVVSTRFAVDSEYVIEGFFSWNMGTRALVSFILIYYFVSRFWKPYKLVWILFILASSVVFVLGVLNTFSVDPLHMLIDKLGARISTIGNNNWMAGYLTVIMPVSLAMYINEKRTATRLLLLIPIIICSAMCITNSAMSTLLGYGTVMTVLFCYSFRSNMHMKHFLEVLLVSVLTWRIIGLIQIHNPEIVAIDEKIMLVLSQYKFMWLVLAAVAVIYLVYNFVDYKTSFDVRRMKWIRIVTVSTEILIAGALIGYIYLNTKGMLPDRFLSANSMLYFDNKWASGRGRIYREAMSAIKLMANERLMRVLFGFGPDQYFNAVENVYGIGAYTAGITSKMTTCAHCEILNTMITLGLLGTVSLFGFYISSAVRFLRRVNKSYMLLIPATAVIAYVVHNMVSFQQIVVTPIVFMMIGMGEAVCRRKSNKKKSTEPVPAQTESEVSVSETA